MSGAEGAVFCRSREVMDHFCSFFFLLYHNSIMYFFKKYFTFNYT